MITPIETKLKRICDIIEINMREWTGMAYRLSGVYHKISASAKVRIELISPFLLNYGRKRITGRIFVRYLIKHYEKERRGILQ